ncbi:hypothetical protein AXI59_15675 [Bacillus nakamurai]|uniref:hypothetical protein n=1 Tax=Bacillus nakamurai TaxID=1793963 RepID=UPI0007782E97|nr:hypothetical protein [Bacillus nakamurai]KXZ18972.1 hypothetical protein AXI59_15675 [Bacillus nakamurai]MCC9021502.1 hypothetical protein [Bacillus nakamurai]
MRTLKTRFKRLLRLRNFEFFQVISAENNDYIAHLLIHDAKSAKDCIDVYLIYTHDLDDDSYKDVVSFNDDLLGMKYRRSHFMNLLKVEEEFNFDFPFDMLAIRNYVQEILNILGIDETLPTMEESDFDRLSQD